MPPPSPVLARQDVSRRPRPRTAHAAIRRFGPEALRLQVTRAAAVSDRIADLALSFPAALAAIATAERGRDATERAKALVIGGAPLRDVAQALDLPLWLRRLGPEAFRAPIPGLPDTVDFRCRIANQLPKPALAPDTWLAWIGTAYAACDADFAIWAAREFNRQKSHGAARGLEAAGMFAWYSQHPGLEASVLIRQRWSAAMSLDDVCMEADNWVERLRFKVRPPGCLRELGERGCDLDGFRFQRLGSPADFFAASNALGNCLDAYADCLNEAREVWSISERGRVLAAFEIEFDRKQPDLPTLLQVRAGCNELAGPRVLGPLYRLLAEWPAELGPGPAVTSTVAAKPDGGIYRRLLKPYWLAKKTHRLVPLEPEAELFDAYESGLSRLRYPSRNPRRRRPPRA